MGLNLNLADSAAISSTGTGIFKGTEKLAPGIYAVVLPGKQLRAEFLVDKQQTISIQVDTTDMVNKTIITGSPENIPYMQYQKFVAVKGKQLQAERIAYISSVTRADSALHEKNYNTYTTQLNEYRENIIKTQPKSMMAVLLEAMKDPKVPSTIPISHKDSVENYNYYKSHYWDGISFMDDRIIRTPFFIGKLERYYRDVMPKAADSIIKDADYKLLLARSSPGMFKYLLNWLTDEYLNPKYMGQDAVFVHLWERYHSKGLSNWLSAYQMEIINRRAYMLMANLIGEKAANLELIDSTGKPAPLYDVSADYTVVCFWDPNCGHCKIELPRLDSIYQASWKNHGVKIYAVFTPDDKANNKAEWVNYTKGHYLSDWIHVYQTKEMEVADNKAQKPSFRQLYDVTITPTLYLLDKDKRIIGKKLSWEQMNELLEVKWKN
jgi:thiol-disulfide isomerase/thioredoxin